MGISKKAAWLASGVILAASAGLVASVNSDKLETLLNYQGTAQCNPSVIHEPFTTEGVQRVVKDAIAAGQKVMTGSRKFKSQIDAACVEDGGVQLTLHNMSKILEIDHENMTITAEAGMRYVDFAAQAREAGYSVSMLTELNSFTLGGMLGSGTHGSTFTAKSNMLSEYVTKIKMVDGNGDIRVLTAEDGELMNAARVNLGVLGVVTEVTVQMEPRYKVKSDVSTMRSDKKLEEKILDIATNNYSANIAWFPGLGKVSLNVYNRVPNDTPGVAYNDQAHVNKFKKFFMKMIFNSLHEARSTGLQCFAANMRYQTRLNDFFRDSESGKLVRDTPVGWSDQMQHFGCSGDAGCVWEFLPIQLQEIAIPLDQLPNWIADARKVIENNPRTCFPLNGIYFRFGKAGESHLSMAHGRDTAFVGIEYTLRKRGEKPPKNYFVNLELEQMTIRKYNGRPHWGKNSVAIFENMPSKFEKWDEFMAAKAEMDPNNIFTNPFFKRATGEDSLDNYKYEGCETTGGCYCTEDSHCTEGLTCQAGGYFTEYKSCRPPQ